MLLRTRCRHFTCLCPKFLPVHALLLQLLPRLLELRLIHLQLILLLLEARRVLRHRRRALLRRRQLAAHRRRRRFGGLLGLQQLVRLLRLLRQLGTNRTELLRRLSAAKRDMGDEGQAGYTAGKPTHDGAAGSPRRCASRHPRKNRAQPVRPVPT